MTAQRYILGLDTSCDETSLAVLDTHTQKIVKNWISSQIKLHAEYGGVVPELASRAHLENLPPMILALFKELQLTPQDFKGIAVTQTPGLMGCLLLGTSFAKAFAIRHKLELYPINHLQAHLFSPFIDKKPEFPFLGLVVSGGHTAFYKADDFENITLLGQTVDDAAGEAFDKGAKMLGLGYPGGPVVDRLAQKGEGRFKFSRPKVKWDEHLMSFSGIKTALKIHIEREKALLGEVEPQAFSETTQNDLCASLQNAIVDALIEKLILFSKKAEFKSVALSGGVAMNSLLRKRVRQTCEDLNITCELAAPAYCTDNAAMVAYLAYHQNQPLDPFLFTPKASVKVQAKDLWQKAKDKSAS